MRLTDGGALAVQGALSAETYEKGELSLSVVVLPLGESPSSAKGVRHSGKPHVRNGLPLSITPSHFEPQRKP